jgi:hypothetical protein
MLSGLAAMKQRGKKIMKTGANPVFFYQPSHFKHLIQIFLKTISALASKDQKKGTDRSL